MTSIYFPRVSSTITPALPSNSTYKLDLARVLTRALGNDPQFKFLLPDAGERDRLVLRLFTGALYAAQRDGEVFTSEDGHGRVNGVAIWARPGSSASLGHRLATFLPEESYPAESRTRCVTLGNYLEAIHQRLAPEAHWRLFAAGVDPLMSASESLERLLKPQLERADENRLACYVEAFDLRSLCSFERLGFRIAGSGQVLDAGPDFWVLIRPPSS